MSGMVLSFLLAAVVAATSLIEVTVSQGIFAFSPVAAVVTPSKMHNRDTANGVGDGPRVARLLVCLPAVAALYVAF